MTLPKPLTLKWFWKILQIKKPDKSVSKRSVLKQFVCNCLNLYYTKFKTSFFDFYRVEGPTINFLIESQFLAPVLLPSPGSGSSLGSDSSSRSASRGDQQNCLTSTVLRCLRQTPEKWKLNKVTARCRQTICLQRAVTLLLVRYGQHYIQCRKINVFK